MNKPTYHPRDLPNLEGFRFIGYRSDGTTGLCEIALDQSHYVIGDIKYCDLVKWEYLDEKEKEGEE